MSEYSEKLKDPRWQKKRLEIMQRDGFECKHCNCKSKELNVHHLYYEKFINPWESNNNYLITLCKDCHENRHVLEDNLKILISKIHDNDSLFEIQGILHHLISFNPYKLDLLNKFLKDFTS